MSAQNTLQFRAEVHFENSQTLPGIILLNTVNGSVYLNFYKRNLDDKNDKIPRGSSPDQVRELAQYFCYKIVLKNHEVYVIFDDFEKGPQILNNKIYPQSKQKSNKKSPLFFKIVGIRSEIDNNETSFNLHQILSDFIIFLKQKYQVISYHSMPYCYLINPFDRGPSNAHTTFLIPQNSMPPDPIGDIIQTIEGFKVIKEFSPLNEQKRFTSLTDTFKNPKFECNADYIQIRDNWKQMFDKKYEPILENQKVFKEIVEKVDTNISKIPELNEEEVLREIMHNVILTYVHYNWDGSKFLCDNVRFLYVILDAYVSEFGKDFDQSKQDLCEKHLFQTLNYIYIFGLFSDFNSLRMQKLFSTALLRVTLFFCKMLPSVIPYLIQKDIISLDFMVEDCSNWFLYMFKASDLQKIWNEIAQYNDIFHFFKCFVVSLLILLKDEIDNIQVPNETIFLRRFQKIKKEFGGESVDKLITYARHFHSMFENEIFKD